MSNVITINDGYKTYDIKNQDGKLLGQFSFNPSDTSIVKRHANVVERLENLEISEQKDNLLKSLDEIEKIIYEEINYLFDAEVAESFFSIMGPLSPLENGQFFVESVLDAIGQVIQAETGERVKKINGKINKHTSKYHG